MEPDKAEQTAELTQYQGFQDTYNTLLMRLDPTPTLERIRHLLLNERYLDKEEKWEKIKGLRPKMNKEGVEKLMLELYSRMSIDKILGNLKEARVNIYVRQLGEVVLSFLWHHADRFEIDESEFESIIHLVLQNVDMILRRALNALENVMLNKSMQYREIMSKIQKEFPGAGFTEPVHEPKRGLNFFGRRVA